MAVSLQRKNDGSVALFIDGDLQFDSRDEHIYHEALVSPALLAAIARNAGRGLRALIIGGGDGLSARELLKCPLVESIELIDYDPAVINMAKSEFSWLNKESLSDPRVKVLCQDAWVYVAAAARAGEHYDIIISDLTVAQNPSEAKFHSTDWYEMIQVLLGERGVLAANTVSSQATPEAYWSIFNSMLYSGLKPYPFHVVLPSFRSQGYGRDWGFMLAANSKIKSTDLDIQEENFADKQFLKSEQQLKALFHFPEEFIRPRQYSLPYRAGSDILLHYFFNSLEIVSLSEATWNSLDLNHADLLVANPDDSQRILPPEIRTELSIANKSSSPAADLFQRVVSLVPALHRAQTRELVEDFVSEPLRFLEAIDLPELVDRLLKRAAELPSLVVAELKLLHDRLKEWQGDYSELLRLGTRVMTVVTLVVIIGNLMHPDAAYGKGGDHGGHGGEHGGDHGADRGDHGSRGDHGDRGFGDRGRGWGGRGWGYGHWGSYGHWGHYGWARPGHAWGWGGWGGWGGYGGWSVPVYAGGGGFLNVNLGSNNSNNSTPGNSTTNNYSQQSVDEEGNTYPARTYNYAQNQNDNNDDGDDQTASNSQDNGPVDRATADYRLGPDTDILPSGQVAIKLTDGAYLMITPQKMQIIDQASGKKIISLANDDSLIFNISREIERQQKGLQSAAQSKQSSINWSQNAGFNNQTGDEQTEADNIQSAVDRLAKAAQNIPPAPEKQPQMQPPLPGAIEVFASTYMSPDGKWVIFKRADGSLAYMNGKNWYSDMGVTPIKKPYPTAFKSVVQSYLSGLVKDSAKEQASLQQDQQEVGEQMQQLKQELQQYTADPNADPSQPVDFGSTQIPRDHAIKRTKVILSRAQRRLDLLQKQMNAIPQETDCANKILASFQS